jgi:hypothetical protein
MNILSRVKDYKELLLSIDGINYVDIYPLKDENFNDANGHVTCVVRNHKKEKIDKELIQKAQKLVSEYTPVGAKIHIITL